MDSLKQAGNPVKHSQYEVSQILVLREDNPEKKICHTNYWSCWSLQ